MIHFPSSWLVVFFGVYVVFPVLFLCLLRTMSMKLKCSFPTVSDFILFFYLPPPLGIAGCYALLYIRGHSHSPPLIRHYLSYLISTFAETTPGHMAPTRECTHLTNRATSQCEIVTIFFQACEASRHIFSTSCGFETLTRISQRIRQKQGLSPGPSNLPSK